MLLKSDLADDKLAMMFRFVSLGCDRQSAFQIDRHQGVGVSHFFDRVGSTLDGAARLIDADFVGFLEDAGLYWLYADSGLRTVIDTSFEIDVTHEFRRQDRMELQRVRALYRIRARWFRELFDEDSPPTCFVRRWDARDRGDADDAPLALLALLRSRRRDVRLLYLHEDETRPLRVAPGCRSVFLPQQNPADRAGLDSAWRRVLSDAAGSVHGEDGNGFALPVRGVPRFA